MSSNDTKDEIQLDGPKVDHVAAMRLRPEPPRVTRLSRKVLAGAGLVAGLGIGAALIYALQGRDKGAGGEELYSTENRSQADGLAGLPRDYAGPILGPPLPGDLGRPILSAQNRGQPVVPPTLQPPPVDPEQQRRLAEQEAARTSRVFFQSTTASLGASAGTLPSMSAGAGAEVLGGASAQDRQLAFLNAAVDRRVVASDRVMAPASPFVLQAGAVISAALITGIRSDLPGQVAAQVTDNVYDSPTGRSLIIPKAQGSSVSTTTMSAWARSASFWSGTG